MPWSAQGLGSYNQGGIWCREAASHEHVFAFSQQEAGPMQRIKRAAALKRQWHSHEHASLALVP